MTFGLLGWQRLDCWVICWTSGYLDCTRPTCLNASLALLFIWDNFAEVLTNHLKITSIKTNKCKEEEKNIKASKKGWITGNVESCFIERHSKQKLCKSLSSNDTPTFCSQGPKLPGSRQHCCLPISQRQCCLPPHPPPPKRLAHV